MAFAKARGSFRHIREESLQFPSRSVNYSRARQKFAKSAIAYLEALAQMQSQYGGGVVVFNEVLGLNLKFKSSCAGQDFNPLARFRFCQVFNRTF